MFDNTQIIEKDIDNPETFLFEDCRISPQVNVSVVIPVKDEEEYILKSLAAFTKQFDLDGKLLNPLLFEILILANNCSDISVSLVKQFQHSNPRLNLHLEEIKLKSHQANIGFVRRSLMEIACDRLSKNGGGIIMTTDADTIVSNNWIAENMAEINLGAEAVGGRILLAEDEILNLDSSTYSYLLKDEKYQLLIVELESHILNTEHDLFPRHHQHFNGSFAITTECYRRSGGIPKVTHLEDIAFFEKLQHIDAKIRHSNKVIVSTSARCVGRTEVGLSYQLNEWRNLGKEGSPFLVESAESIVERLKFKKNLKDFWDKRNLDERTFRDYLNENIPDLPDKFKDKQTLLNYQFFGKFYANVLENYDLTSQYQLISIDDAIRELESLVINFH